MHQFPTLDEMTRHAAQCNQHKSLLTHEPGPSLMRALPSSFSKPCKPSETGKYQEKGWKMANGNPLRFYQIYGHNHNTNNSMEQVSHLDSLQLERYLTPFIPLDISYQATLFLRCWFSLHALGTMPFAAGKHLMTLAKRSWKDGWMQKAIVMANNIADNCQVTTRGH